MRISAPRSAHRSSLAARTGGHRDAGAQCPGHLDGVGADAAGAAVHQQHLAGGQVRGHDQVGPHRAGHLGQGGGVLTLTPAGIGITWPAGHRDVLGVAAAGSSAQTCCPTAHSDTPSPTAAIDAGDLQAEDVARAGRRRILAGRLQQVGPVDPGRADLDQHLAGSG